MKDYYTKKELKELSKYRNDYGILSSMAFPLIYNSRISFFDKSVWENDTENFILSYDDKIKECKEYVESIVDKINPDDLVQMLDIQVVESYNKDSFITSFEKYTVCSNLCCYSFKVPFDWNVEKCPIICFTDIDGFIKNTNKIINDNYDFTLQENDFYIYGADCSAIQDTVCCFYKDVEKKHKFVMKIIEESQKKVCDFLKNN